MLTKNIVNLSIFIGTFNFIYAEIIDQKSLFIPSEFKDISVYHNDNGFSVKTATGSYEIQRCFMDKELRGISKKQLAATLATGSYLAINKMNGSNDYSLKLHGRLKGGGAGGAQVGMWVGKLGTYVIGYGAIGLVSTTPLVGPGLSQGLIITLAPTIEATSNAMAIAGDILGGIATGPV